MHFLNTHQTIKSIIEPIRMVNVREKRLRPNEFRLSTWDGEDATELHGIGKYGSDSYELFYKTSVANVGDLESTIH